MNMRMYNMILYKSTLMYIAGPDRVNNVSLICGALDWINQCNATWNVSLYACLHWCLNCMCELLHAYT